MNLQTFTATGIAAAQMQVRAQAIYYRKATLSGGATDETIIVRSAPGGDYLILEPGQGCSVDGDATDWTISNASGIGTIQGELVFGNKGFTDNRLKVNGTVDVVDGGKARTLANTAFIGFGYCAASAGVQSQVQLWNPIGSGKVLFVERVNLYTTGAGVVGFQYRRGTAAHATLVGNPVSKRLNAALSASEVRTAAGAALGIQIFIHDKSQKEFRFTEPVAIDPGACINVCNGNLNEDIGAAFEFFEELTGT